MVIKKPMGGGKREILLAVSGSTPQVITEALYCLRVEKKIPISKVVVITTKKGRGEVLEKLLDKRYGYFWRFLRDYGISSDDLIFSEDDVFVPEKKSGEPIEDIFGPGENELLCSLIVEKVREFTEKDDIVVHASIAGGRKTMSSYLALAMSLFGREQDRMYHVLVSPPEFEFHNQFFYPPPEPIEIRKRTDVKEELINTRLAKVTLIDIPFVRLRKFVGRKKGTLDRIVSEIQSLLDRAEPLPQVVVDFDECQIVVDGAKIGLKPSLFCFFVTLLSLKLDCENEDCVDCRECFVDKEEIGEPGRFAERWEKIYHKAGHPGYYEKSESTFLGEGGLKRFLQYRSKLNGAIERARKEMKITGDVAVLLKVENVGGYRGARYGILLKPASVVNREEVLDAVE